MAKDPARVKAGKKAWAKMSPAKKAKVLARLKRVRPKSTGGGGGKSKALTKSNPTGGGGSTALTKNRKPRGGATYQAVKVTGSAAMPLTDYALTDGPKSADGLIAHLKSRANLELGKGYGVAALDFAVSKHRLVGHAGALSRLSLTAVLPEAYNALKTYEDVVGGKNARTVHHNAALRMTGYGPGTGRFDFKNPEFRLYHKIKWIGAGIRLIANRTKIGRSIVRPIRENVLKELGGAV